MWICSPSKRPTKPYSPSHRRTALRTIASKTGCTSVGELAITRRISAVAVCCSSASVTWLVPRLSEFLEQPHVLDGDDGLVGEGLEQLDLRVGEEARPRSGATKITPIDPPLAEHGHAEGAAEAGRPARHP